MSSARTGRLRGWQRGFVYVLLLSCAVSGVVYLLKNEFDFSWEALSGHQVLAWHGISAIGAAVAVGSLLPTHIRAAWILRRNNRWLGAVLLLVMAMLLMSGVWLYYGPAETRDGVVAFHWWMGVVLLGVLPLHIIVGRFAASRLRRD